MERVVGPVDGYYVAIFTRELDGKFRASYKVCEAAPADYRSAPPVRHGRVDGTSDTLAHAFELAEQLARLQIARLRDAKESRWATGSAIMYAPTEPCPLYAAPGD
ncbi:MAG: hypothetical protein JWP43_325 [Ramlibacter sp.]|jgi:hypothetical protein|nr:hypothetical protein [Ramlibacter sp.]